MNKLTYKQAYDKIIEAYFKDEIKPFNSEFCFCGTLCNNSDAWSLCTVKKKHNDFGNYLGVEYVKMEQALFSGLKNNKEEYDGGHNPGHPDFEDRLFSGMSTALEVLKQIHRDRGEDVDEVPELTKRILVSSLK